MDIEGERKNRRRRKRDGGRDRTRTRRYRKERGKRGGCPPLPVSRWGETKEKRERERKRRVAYNRGSEGATRK